MKTRAFNLATDFPALTELLNEIAKADSGTPVTEEQQRGQADYFGESRFFFFKQWVVENSDKGLIAYAWMYQQLATPYAEFEIAIHRNENIDAHLLVTIIEAAKKQGVAYISVFAQPNNEVARAFYLKRGFRPEGGFRLLSLEITQPLPLPEIPSEFALRTYEQINDINIWVESADAGWADLPGHKVAILEQAKELLETNPEDEIFLLFDANDKVVGRVGITLHGEQGNVDSPGIALEHRTANLYRQLVLLGLQELVKRDCKNVQMCSWGDYDSTIVAYAELGFKTTIHELGYRLDLQ
jgi:GNAT superfamily N-acetyltransferase